MKAYLDLMRKIMSTGEHRSDRTGTGTQSLFGEHLEFDLRDGLPLLTTKKLHTRSIVHELIWFLNGDTNIKYLNDNDVRIWDEWASEDGGVGPVYGAQWRSWQSYKPGESYDQIQSLLNRIRDKPQDRRLLVSTWNVAQIDQMKLPCCHVLFQCYVHMDGRLSLQMYQRSADLFLGVPFNIASYALLTHLLAKVTGLRPGFLKITFGDVHIYSNHFEQCRKQLSREPGPLPHLVLGDIPADLRGISFDSIKVVDYCPQSRITAPVAV